MLFNEPFSPKANKISPIHLSNEIRSDYMNIEAKSAESQNPELPKQKTDDAVYFPSSQTVDNLVTLQTKPKMFKNRSLYFVRFGSVLNNAAESFFKSEIRRRLFVTAMLIVMSRVGYFVPLPGFDRRLIPKDYLSFVSGSVGK